MNTASLRQDYKERIVPILVKEFGYTSVMQAPKLEKIVLNQGLGLAVSDKKIIEVAINEMTTITGQKAVATISKKDISNFKSGGRIFAKEVTDPERFGVVEFDQDKKAISIEEKPAQPKSNYAVTGLYIYDNTVIGKAKSLQPSARGELEITDINNAYLERQQLNVELLGRGFAWLDTGTHDSLLEAGQFVQTIEHRQGLKVACLEEISYHNGWLNDTQLLERANFFKKTGYGQYLLKLHEEHQH